VPSLDTYTSVFNDANRVAQHDCNINKGRKDIGTFTRTYTHTRARQSSSEVIPPRALLFPRQLVRFKFGLQVGEIEREIKQTRNERIERGEFRSRARLNTARHRARVRAAQCFRRTKARDEESERPIRGGAPRRGFRIADFNPCNPFRRHPSFKRARTKAALRVTDRDDAATALSALFAFIPRLLAGGSRRPRNAGVLESARESRNARERLHSPSFSDDAAIRVFLPRSHGARRTIDCLFPIRSELPPSSIQALPRLRRCKIAVYRIPAAFIALLDVCFE